jgi:hypothetical protein
MKITTLFFLVILGFSNHAQQFTLPAEEYPFFDIVEWKGTGSLLLNRDPSGLKKKINVTMVGENATSTWQESFNPNTDAYYFISSENARYVYFLDQLEDWFGHELIYKLFGEKGIIYHPRVEDSLLDMKLIKVRTWPSVRNQ